MSVKRTVSALLDGMSAAMYAALFVAVVWIENKWRKTIFGQGRR